MGTMSGSQFTTLVSTDEVARRLDDSNWVIVDCRYDLMDPEAGGRVYLEAHVPKAQYAHLGEDLSGPPLTDHGRHPLPSAQAMTALFSRLGVTSGVQVVVYDQSDGALAARLWWMLRYMGHDAVAVLDGGFAAWRDAGLPTQSGQANAAPSVFEGAPRSEWLVTIDSVPNVRCLVDTRLAPRYRGDQEPLDPVAGHIPGARNHPYTDNVDEKGRFLPPQRLAARFTETLGAHLPNSAVYYCGSGVTACHLLLAAAHAGLPAGKLYLGSWSEWCRDPARPVTRGADPGTPLYS